MSRFTFAALASAVLSGTLAAQQVPGRDLFEFPLGLLAEAPALSSRMVGSIWNPAATIPRSGRASVGVAGLTTPNEQGVDLAMVGADVLGPRRLIFSLSYAQASVRDIFRTTSDPCVCENVAPDIPYQTSLLSLGSAWARDNVTIGLAARLRSAHFDSDRSSVGSLDAGAVLDRIAGTPLRLAGSTFLFSPARSREAATFMGAADLPILTRDSTATVRAGYSVSHTEGRGREDYLFATGSFQQLDASAGLSHAAYYGNTSKRLRIGIGVRYAGYDVAFGREDGAAGISASYQVMLTRVIR